MTIQEKTRKEALDKYYANPNYCKNCGEVIPVLSHEAARTVRRKKFCSKSCAASYNNRGICRNATLKIRVKDEEEIQHHESKKRQKVHRKTHWSDFVSKDEFLGVVLQSNSIKDVLITFGRSTSRMDYNVVKNLLARYSADISHWYKNHSNQAPPPKKAKPLSEIMIENSTYNGTHLKRRLIREGTFKNECAICGQSTSWNGQDLVMIMDHINGINTDHRLGNLRLVCPNCDSQLPTYKSRNKKIKT